MKEKMEEKIVGYDEYLTALEELNLQYELLEEDLNLPYNFFTIDAPTSFGKRVDNKTVPLENGDLSSFPVEARLKISEEEHLLNYGLKGIRAAELATELARQFKYNGYRIQMDEAQYMPRRVHIPVQHDVLKHAFQEWEKKLEELLEDCYMQSDEEKPLLSFEIRVRAQSVGIKWVNVFVHVNFNFSFATFDHMEDVAKIYWKAVKLASEFPYNNFQLVNEKGERDLTIHGTWLNATHL